MDIDIFSERSPKSNEVEAASSDMINKSDTKPFAKEPKFNVESLRTDLDAYTEFKSKLMGLLGQIEAEIFERQTHQAVLDLKERGLLDDFYQMRADITKQPIYERRAYKRIKAFVWMLNAYELLETGEIDEDSPFHVQGDQRRSSKAAPEEQTNLLSIKQWRDFIDHHKNYLSIFPELGEHAVVQ
jgi:hypothetical protein